MNELELAEYRRGRLVAAVKHVSNGNKEDFGKKLGLKSGAFIRQMIAGTRGITEKTIRPIENLPGMAGWFDLPSRTRVVSADQKVSRPPSPDEEKALLEAFRSLDVTERGYLLEDAKKYQAKGKKA